MKKLTVFLCVLALVFGVIGTANTATLDMTMDTLVANVGPQVTSEFNFTIEVDDTTGDVLGWTNFMSNQLYTYEAGGYDPRDGGPFAAKEQVYPNGVYQSASTAFDGDTSAAGTTMWFRYPSNTDGPMFIMVFNVGVLGLTYDSATGLGTMAFGPNMALCETYYFHEAVPIPSAIWLLGSGLTGLVGVRRKFRKEVS